MDKSHASWEVKKSVVMQILISSNRGKKEAPIMFVVKVTNKYNTLMGESQLSPVC